MGFLDNVLSKISSDFSKYAGDSAFLSAAVSASALVVNADGQIDDSEINAALKGLSENPKLASAYKPAVIEDELTKALNASKTRAGKITLNRAIESISARPLEQRQDIILIAADVADDGSIGSEEKDVLIGVGKLLGIDAAKFLSI